MIHRRLLFVETLRSVRELQRICGSRTSMNTAAASNHPWSIVVNDNEMQSGEHDSVRTMLRVLGPIVALVGLIFLGIGIGSFFSAFGTFGTPRYFWCAFVGMPVLAVGIGLCKYGYMGAVYRYMANETAPVAKDVVNYLGEKTQPGIKSIAKAATEGILEGKNEQPPRQDA